MAVLCLTTLGVIGYNMFWVLYCKKNNIKVSKRFIVGLYLFAIYLGLVLEITAPGTIIDITKSSTISINLIPFNDLIASGGRGVSIFGLVTNTILFMPLGVLLPSLWNKFDSFINTVLAGLGFSLAIEIFQLLNFRATDIDDLMMNTLGAAIGYIIYLIIFKRFTLKFKLENKGSDKKVVKYNAKLFMALMFSLYFFMSPVVNSMLYEMMVR